MTFSYTVTNNGPNAVWAGTGYWTDFLWLSADPTFDRMRASFLGQTTHVQDPNSPLQPGQSYNVSYTATLPAGTGGHYYLYIDLDAHNDLNPSLYIYQARLEDTTWWPADTGDNTYWLDQFDHWAFENPNNNRIGTPLNITYSEPDLKVTISPPPAATAGQTAAITYTVTNQGTRATRVDGWTDRIFLSQDPSLDTYDTVLGDSSYGQGVPLQPGGSYTNTVDVRIPDGIQGTFYVLVYADSDASTNYNVQSNIGYYNYGVTIGGNNELDAYDLVSASVRSLGRGKVPQYEQEADKVTSAALTVTLPPSPDLRVTAVSSTPITRATSTRARR